MSPASRRSADLSIAATAHPNGLDLHTRNVDDSSERRNSSTPRRSDFTSALSEGENSVTPQEVALYALDVHPYAPLNVTVATPLIELRGASDDLLQGLVPLVRAGQADADPPPFDDPMSLYESCLLYTSPSPRDS